MIIGVDASKMDQPRAGIGHYLANMVECMSALDGETTFLLYSNRPLRDHPKKDNVKIRFLPGSFPPWWTQVLLPKALTSDGVDLFWGGNYAIPLHRGGLWKVATLHDFTFRKFPATLPMKRLLHLRVMVPLYLKYADRVIVVSMHTARDLYRYYSYPVEKTRVIPLAAREGFFNEVGQAGREAVLRKHGLKKGYLLFVGTVEPRKGLDTAIKALAILREKKGSCPPLAVVGQIGWKAGGIMKEAKKYRLQDEISFLQYVEEEEMPALYQSASALVFPSLYEGFGLPVLEAMASRLPVISSTSSSLPEVGGEAPLYFRTGDSGHLVQVLEELLSNRGLQEELGARGWARARSFSWEKTARETLELFRQIAAEGLSSQPK